MWHIKRKDFIGPYFFDENVNDNNYLHFLQQRLPALLEDIDLDTRQRIFFQQEVCLCTGVEELVTI